MARDLSTLSKALESVRDGGDVPEYFHDRVYPVGHPEMPEGGRVVEARWADGSKVSFVLADGKSQSRRTAKMWGWDGTGDA